MQEATDANLGRTVRAVLHTFGILTTSLSRQKIHSEYCCYTPVIYTASSFYDQKITGYDN